MSRRCDIILSGFEKHHPEVLKATSPFDWIRGQGAGQGGKPGNLGLSIKERLSKAFAAMKVCI